MVLPLPQDDPDPHRAAGLRCIAPDLVGFGRSDKPTERADYTYARHVEWMRAALFDALDLHDVTLVCQDWGGLIGLRLVGEHPDRFARVVTANTFLPTGEKPPGKAFLGWQNFSQTVEDFDVGFIVGMGCHTAPTDDVIAAYNAPFPDDSYKAGARQFPMLVPTSPDDPASDANRKAWETLRWNKPFLTAFSDQDAITAAATARSNATYPAAPVNRTPRSKAAGTSSRKTAASNSRRSSRAGSPSSVETSTSLALLDQVRAIAQTGLHYATDPFDRDRYEQLLALATREYADRSGLDVADVRARFAKDLGYVTAKVGADAAIFDEHDRILLVRRADDGRWGLIAGWVDANETPERTVVREVAEEVGLVASVDQLVGVFAREAGADDNPHSVVSVVYLCGVIGGELARSRTRSARSRGGRSTTSTDWHHHHETLARAALEAHWRRAAGG